MDIKQQLKITSDQLNNLSTSPIQILPAYSNQIAIVSTFGINYIYGTTPYDTNGAIFAISSSPTYSPGDPIYYSFSPDFLGAPESSFFIAQEFTTPTSGYLTSNFANTATYLINIGTGDVIGGDGTISLLIWGGSLFIDE